MSRHAKPRLFNIASDIAFLDLLAAKILAGGFPLAGTPPPAPVELMQWRIYVPTRRAAGMLKEAFLRQSGAQAVLLPQIIPLGDAGEDELLLGMDDMAVDGALLSSLPPPAPPLLRRLVLTRLIMACDKAIHAANHELGRSHDNFSTPAQAASLAAELERLMDSVELEQASWDMLGELVPDSYARNWQITLEFLKIVTEYWPEYEKEHGFISAMARRNALIAARAAHLAAIPPAAPVIAAGSTGSTPATAELLSIIASLPAGAVVLPGLDMYLDTESWQGLGPDHPQYGMRQLLIRMEAERLEDITVLEPENIAAGRPGAIREKLASEMMRPADKTGLWQSLRARITPRKAAAALQDVTLIEAPDARREAQVIALIMRKTLEDEGRSAALVTPDRVLARRVSAELARWDIKIEDSAGRPLRSTLPGRFLLLLIEALLADFTPELLLSLLKHPFCAPAMARQEYDSALRCLDLALRGPRPAAGLAGIENALTSARISARDNPYCHPALRRLDDDDWQNAAKLTGLLKTAAAPFCRLLHEGQTAELQKLLHVHIDAAQALTCGADEDFISPLWQGEAGEAAMEFFAAIDAAATDADRPDIAQYGRFLEVLMRDITPRPRQSAHPRLFIRGALEARLQSADVTILGGLNENIWPDITRTDPWLSRPMREKLGLEPLERRIGLSAHDFAQGFAMGEVYLTRAEKIDGTPTVPSRWLLRLQAVLKGLDIEDALKPDEQTPWLGWCEALGSAPEHIPVEPPAPCPPVELRPRRMSVSSIEAWIRDPYEIYAKSILKLRPLDELEMQPGAMEKGIIIHDIMQKFIEKHPEGKLAANAYDDLLAIANSEFETLANRPDLRAFWQRRFADIARWMIAYEGKARTDIAYIHAETTARYEIPGTQPPFTLTARADRIDILTSGGARIIDYKTGAPPTATVVAAGLAPQLPLEALMLAAGAFENIAPLKVEDLVYLRLSGGNPAGEVKNVSPKSSAMQLAGEAVVALSEAIALYDQPGTPYVVRRIAQYERRYGDYDHLARTKEWQLLENAGERP